VTDTGLGIPERMLGQVFDMFTQVNNTLERAQGGLGIGLALVRQLVEMHGGSVVAESAGAGLGSTFSIRLPMAAAPPNTFIGLPDSLPPMLPCRRILVVDDNVDAAMMLAMMLGLSGHVTRTAFTGEEALDAAAEFQPEIAFVDIGLPGIDGHEVARRFRAAPLLNGVFLVALTGWGGEDDRRRSRGSRFRCAPDQAGRSGRHRRLAAAIRSDRQGLRSRGMGRDQSAPICSPSSRPRCEAALIASTIARFTPDCSMLVNAA
jgi:CheY-like chemotaxis protein